MNRAAESFWIETLADLRQAGLRRELRTLSTAQGREVVVNGKKLLNFSSNDYLGLAGDVRLKEAASQALNEEGFGSGASRLICGNMSAHRKLEERIAAFKGSARCLVFSTGYMANVGIISSIFGRDDIIFSDRLNHASIVDGIQLSRAKCRRYPHCNMESLEEMLKETRGFRRRGIITDSVFSMDGDWAPLERIVTLAKQYDCVVMVDEAHAFGVLGKKGRGLAEHLGLEDEIDIQMGTLSKAAGSFGAYCCGSHELISFLINKARSFIYTTGMPPSVAAASLKAVDIIEQEPQRRQRLWDNTRCVRSALKEMGFDTMDSQTPIIPLLVRDSEAAVMYSRHLFEKGILIPAIRPPTVPEGTARLRLTVTASHNQSDLDYLLQQLKEIGKQECLI